LVTGRDPYAQISKTAGILLRPGESTGSELFLMNGIAGIVWSGWAK